MRITLKAGTVVAGSIVVLGVFGVGSSFADDSQFENRLSLFQEDSAKPAVNVGVNKLGRPTTSWGLPPLTDSKPLKVATTEPPKEVIDQAVAKSPRKLKKRLRPKRRAAKSSNWIERFLQGK